MVWSLLTRVIWPSRTLMWLGTCTKGASAAVTTPRASESGRPSRHHPVEEVRRPRLIAREDGFGEQVKGSVLADPICGQCHRLSPRRCDEDGARLPCPEGAILPPPPHAVKRIGFAASGHSCRLPSITHDTRLEEDRQCA